MGRAAQAAQFALLAELKTIYPVQNPTQVLPTIRWVSLPTLERARANSREEVALSVALGWIAHILATVSTVINVPLRWVTDCQSAL